MIRVISTDEWAKLEFLGVDTLDSFRALVAQMDASRLVADACAVSLIELSSFQIPPALFSKPAYGSDRPYLKKKKGRS